jgi:hypothetical protein
MQGWFLNRDRVLYKQRNVIKIQGGEELDLEPDPRPPTVSLPPVQPPRKLDSSKVSPEERRKLIAAGVKAGKSLRLIAQELNVTATTIQRDMKVQGINANKKPTVTRRKKKAAVWERSRRATPERKVAAQTPTKPHQLAPIPTKPHQLAPTPTKPLKLTPTLTKPHQLAPTPTKRIKLRKRIILPPRPVFPPRAVSEPPKPGPSKPLSPEELRRQHLEEMLQLVGSWLLERKPDYWLAINVLDKARNHLAASKDLSAWGSPESPPESPMSAAQLRDRTRPQEMDSANNTDRREEVCALWLARWLAAWAREDKQLRKEVLDWVRARVTA